MISIVFGLMRSYSYFRYQHLATNHSIIGDGVLRQKKRLLPEGAHNPGLLWSYPLDMKSIKFPKMALRRFLLPGGALYLQGELHTPDPLGLRSLFESGQSL